MTFNQLLLRLFALVSLAILAAGVWLVWDYAARLSATGSAPIELIAWGGALVAWSFGGGATMTMLLGRDGDLHGRYEPGEGGVLDAPDGARLWVERHGDPHAPALILTHDWGLDSTVWRDAKRELARRYRVVVWDLPGLGRSQPAPDGKISVERLAGNLEAVLDSAGGPALLVGHGMGGMIVQALLLQRPELVGGKIAGVALENAPFTNPARTSFLAPVLSALQGPVLKPLLWLEIALSPIAGLIAWQSYLSGWMQLGQRLGGFGPAPCRTLLDHVSWLACTGSAAVKARGVLAMMDWDPGGRRGPALKAVWTDAVVFSAGCDLVVRPWAGADLAALLGAHEDRVSFAGHLGPIECPSWYDHALIAFADHVFMKGAVWADRKAARPAPATVALRESEGRSWAPSAPGAGLRPM